MPDKCISDPARTSIIAAISRLETCPQASGPVITRMRYGEAILDIQGIPKRKFRSLHALATQFPGGIFRDTKEKEGPLKYEGQDTAVEVFEKARFVTAKELERKAWADKDIQKFCDTYGCGEPFSHIYTVTKEERKGVQVVIVSNERPNPEYAPPKPKKAKK